MHNHGKLCFAVCQIELGFGICHHSIRFLTILLFKYKFTTPMMLFICKSAAIKRSRYQGLFIFAKGRAHEELWLAQSLQVSSHLHNYAFQYMYYPVAEHCQSLKATHPCIL